MDDPEERREAYQGGLVCCDVVLPGEAYLRCVVVSCGAVEGSA